MRERLIQCERVLKKTGSIYLHCDWHASHYLKQMMDEIFGYDNFINEIIWQRTSSAKSQTKGFGKVHDIIFLYSKSKDFKFNRIYVEYNEGYIEKFYNKIEKKTERRFMSDNFSQNGDGVARKFGNKVIAPQKGKHWIWTQEKIDEGWKEGRIYLSSNGVPRLKRYLDESKGQPVTDLWIDIPNLQGNDGENLGYPTQKPEALLQRITEASSKPTDIVLDPFCGCGTTLAVAKKLGRRFIGIDISRVACDVMKKRLGGNVKVIGGESKEELSKMEPHEFARLVIVEKLGGIVNSKKSGDMGIDGWIEFKTIPVQVKRWEHKVGRPEIDKFAHAIERDRKEKGILVADDFSKDCYGEVARIEKEQKIKIDLRKISDIFFKD